MKNIAIIFAGGTGKRMNAHGIPKQFIELYGKPIIIYTLEKFENHEEIDGIVISCLEAWIPQMRRLCEKFHISKVKAIVPGGSTGQESIYNGLAKAAQLCGIGTADCEAARESVSGDELPAADEPAADRQPLVLIHDGVRPLVDHDTITRCIRCASERGNAITVTPATETIITDSADGIVGRILDRSACQLAKAPQTFRLRELFELHRKAIAEGKEDFIDSASLLRYYGRTLYTVEGSTENIKITTPVDYYIFKAIVSAKENSNAFGL